MSGMDDPRVREYRDARADLRRGLSAPQGSRARYQQSLGPYLEHMADNMSPPDSRARRHLMAAFAYGHLEDHGPIIPLGMILAAFRAGIEDAEWLREQQPRFEPEPIDEQARLAALPYGVYLRTAHWKQVRARALAYYGNRCALCNREDGPLEVHHRTYQRRGAERPADVFVLCSECHGRHHHEIKVA